MNMGESDDYPNITKEYSQGYSDGYTDALQGKKIALPQKRKSIEDINTEIEKYYWEKITGEVDYGEFDYDLGYRCGYEDGEKDKNEQDYLDNSWLYEEGEDDTPYDEQDNYEPEVFDNNW